MRYCVKRTNTGEYFKHISNGSLAWTLEVEESLQFAVKSSAQMFITRYLSFNPNIVVVEYDLTTKNMNNAYDRAMGVI